MVRRNQRQLLNPRLESVNVFPQLFENLLQKEDRPSKNFGQGVFTQKERNSGMPLTSEKNDV